MRRFAGAAVAAVSMLCAFAGTASAQEPLPEPKVVPVQVTGAPTERLNIVVMGDGYQKDQQELFRKDLDRNLAVMWATEPFRTYRNYINIYAVELASIDYGVRCDPDGRKRSPDGTVRDTGEREGPIDGKRTALRMIFQNGCADPLSRGTVYGGAPVGCANDAAYYPAGAHPCETGTQAHNLIWTRTSRRCSASRARRRTSRRSRSSTPSPTAASAARRRPPWAARRRGR